MSRSALTSGRPPNRLRRWLKSPTFHAVAALFGTGILAGYFLGRALSPDYEDAIRSQGALVEHVARHAKAQPTSVRSFDRLLSPQGRLVRLTPRFERLQFKCGAQVITYDLTTSGRPSHRFDLKPGEAIQAPRKGLDFLDAATFLFGGLDGYAVNATLPRYLKSLQSTAAGEEVVEGAGRRAATAILGLASGVGVGLWLGYRDDPDCGSPLFQRLLDDEPFWRAVAARQHEMRSWYFRYGPAKVAALDTHRGFPTIVGESGSYRVRSELIAAREPAFLLREIGDTSLQTKPGVRILVNELDRVNPVLARRFEASVKDELYNLGPFSPDATYDVWIRGRPGEVVVAVRTVRKGTAKSDLTASPPLREPEEFRYVPSLL